LAQAQVTIQVAQATNFVQLPAGSGRYSYEAASNQWGTSATIQRIATLGNKWATQFPNRPRLGIGDISLQQGGPMPGHTSGHQQGKNVDIRPVRNDGQEAAVTWQNSAYSQQFTQDLVDKIREDPNVQNIYFNDPNISGVQPLAGHDNHLHVEYAN
jgi:murein endopeptidase